MNSTLPLESLNTDTSFKEDLILDKNFLLLPASVIVTKELLNSLREWEFKEFILDPEPIVNPDKLVFKQNQVEEEEKKEEPESPTKKIYDGIKKAIEDLTNSSVNREDEILEAVKNIYCEYINYTDAVYTYYATHNRIDYDEISDCVKELCVLIRGYKKYVLRSARNADNYGKPFIVSHSMRSTVLAITLGIALHMPITKLIELGVTCILHEIGMLCLPPYLYMTDRVLTEAERIQITGAPLHGFKILKRLNFPLSVQLGVLEFNERENGLGSPRRISGDKISIYAKIIAVSCSFAEKTSYRSPRTSRNPFEVMVEMLHNPKKQYDDTVIKALLHSLSLFPVGTYVYLNNGKIGIVTDVIPGSPKTPILHLLDEKGADGLPKTIQSDNDSNKIVRVLSPKEEQDVIKSIQLKNESRK